MTRVDWPVVLAACDDSERRDALLMAADDLDNRWSEWLRREAHRLRPSGQLPYREVWKHPAWHDQTMLDRWMSSRAPETADERDEYIATIIELEASALPDELINRLSHVMMPWYHESRYGSALEAWQDLFKALEEG